MPLNREREAFQRRAEQLGERYRRWLVMVAESRAALMAGRIDDAEALALQASTLGLGGDDESAFQALGVQLLVVRREQSRLDELLPGAEAFAAQYPEVPAWRCGRRTCMPSSVRKEDASRELDTLGANRFAAIARDAWWLVGMSMLSEVAAFTGHPVHVRVLYELLEPYASHCIVITTMCSGSAARPLGLLATVLGRYDDAERWFEEALARNARIRSPLWVGHTQRDYAAMLLRRDGPGDGDRARALLRDALDTSELGLRAVTRRAEPLVGGAEAPGAGRSGPLRCPRRGAGVHLGGELAEVAFEEVVAAAVGVQAALELQQPDRAEAVHRPQRRLQA